MNEPVDRKSIGAPSSVQDVDAAFCRVYPESASREVEFGLLSHLEWCAEREPETVVCTSPKILTCPSSDCCPRQMEYSFPAMVRSASCVPLQLSLVASVRICFPPGKNPMIYSPRVSMVRAAAVRGIQPEDQKWARKGSWEVLDPFGRGAELAANMAGQRAQPSIPPSSAMKGGSMH